MRISVSCSRAGLAALPANSSSRSAVHRPSFGRGWTSRSYSKDVAPDRSTLRTVFRDTFRSRAISLIVLPLMKCSRRIRPIVSTVSIPHHPLGIKAGSATGQLVRGSILDADPPAQGVKIARRITPTRTIKVASIGTWIGARRNFSLNSFLSAPLAMLTRKSVVTTARATTWVASNRKLSVSARRSIFPIGQLQGYLNLKAYWEFDGLE